jgi:DNA polymerase (family 10)
MSKKKLTAKANFEKTTRSEALDIGKRFEQALSPLCSFMLLAGSIRQGKEMVGDIDIVVIPNDEPEVFLEKVKDVIEYEYGASKKIFGMFQGRPINIFVTNEASKGATTYQCTGPTGYNIRLRRVAKGKGFKLNEYGLWNRDIFTALGLEYRNPEDRKGYKRAVK